jgi:hypothetical protein
MIKPRSFVAALLVALALSPAHAQPKQSADDLYKDGVKQYNLGEFSKAIEQFKAAYALEDKPAYLYNIAQAYRQLGDCKNALFFYRRFLSLKANDTAKPLPANLKAEIEGRIAELDACAKEADSIKGRPPDTQLPPDGDGTTTTDGGTTGSTDGTTGDGTDGGTTGTGPDVAQADGDGDGDGEDEGEVGVTAPAPAGPRLIAIRAVAGAAKVMAGDSDVPIQFSTALTAGYPLRLGPKLTLELGVGFTFTPVPYKKPGGESGTGTLTSLLGNVGVTYAVARKIGIHADVGAGVLWFGGLAEGNPFTEGQMETSGALGMFNLRVAATIDYAVTPNFLVVATPIAFSYSPPKDGLVEDISSLTRLDFMLGVGYRM